MDTLYVNGRTAPKGRFGPFVLSVTVTLQVPKGTTAKLEETQAPMLNFYGVALRLMLHTPPQQRLTLATETLTLTFVKTLAPGDLFTLAHVLVLDGDDAVLNKNAIAHTCLPSLP